MDLQRQYFAALAPNELAPELKRKIQDYRDFVRTTGFVERMKKSYQYYYGFSDKGNFTSSEIGRAGVQGSLAMMKVNHYRNNLQHVLNMTCAQRPAMETRAANSDVESQTQTMLGDGLLDFYMREKRLEKYLKTATEYALVLLEGFIELEWDTQAGSEYGFDPKVDETTGQPVVGPDGKPQGTIIYEGDIKFSVHDSMSVIRDFTREDNENDWVIIQTERNKFDLAAKYPDLAPKILEISPDQERDKFKLRQLKRSADSPMIPVYKFMHRKTEAMPDGRLFIFVSDDCTLFDGPLPYNDMPGGLPIYRIAPSDFLGTPFGYSPALDALSLQEAIDALYSVVITNQTTFGVQNITAPKGHDIQYTRLAEGLNLIEYDKALGKPEALDLCKTPPEIFEFIPQLEALQRILFGLNDVVIGDPQASLKSGSALALVASQAIQFNSGLQQAWAELLEDVGLAVLKMLQQFATTKRVASIIGEFNKSYIKEFQGSDLNKVNRVVVDVANPLSRTAAGRLAQADSLLNAQAVDAEQYLSVVRTGNVEPIEENKTSHLINMRRENELMRNGQQVRALVTDKHSRHVDDHCTLLDSPEARQNPQLAQLVLNHIMEHLQFLRTADPALLAMRGEHSLMPPPMPGPGPGAPPPPHGHPMPAGPPPEKVPGPTVNQKLPSMPQQHINPQNGQRFNPSGSGPTGA